MAIRYPAMKTARGSGFNGGAPKGSLLHNDDAIFGKKNRPDMNQGGGPHGVRNKPNVSMDQRTGAGTRADGRDKVYVRAGMAGARGSSGNPGAGAGTRGGVGGAAGFTAEGRQAFSPETRVSGHGGSPQHREREIPGDFHKRGGVGAYGQESVPGGRKSNVGRMGGASLSDGNTGGEAYARIKGRFKRAAMGARPSGDSGKYGGAPVRANT